MNQKELISKLNNASYKKLTILTIIIFQIIFVVFMTFLLSKKLPPVTNGVIYQIFLHDPMTDYNNIDCHFDYNDDVLPPAEGVNFKPKSNSIFFHDTSCPVALTSRQACAIESAARLHPDRDIYVLFSSPVNEFNLKSTVISKLMDFDNIKLARVHIKEYAKHTPLEKLVDEDKFKLSDFRKALTSDLLRYITLYKWGGIYLDTDMLVVNNLDRLGRNWAAREDPFSVNGAVLAVGRDDLGKKFIDTVINQVANDFKPEVWSYNGPVALTRALTEMCSVTNPSNFSAQNCQGFQVFPPDMFYPAHYSQYGQLFKAHGIDISKMLYTVHFWNTLSSHSKVYPDSVYAELALVCCPTVFGLFRDHFGD